MLVNNRRAVQVIEPQALPQPIEVDVVTHCHVTPAEVSALMVDTLEAPTDALTLEPQAGTGNLIQSLLESGHSINEIVAVERHITLAQGIEKRFSHLGDTNTAEAQHFNVINECFLDYAATAQGKIEYPRILMNPPFKQVRAHMKAALSLLGKAGHDDAILVALVPITYQHEEAELIDTLSNDTFALAKVNTKIIRIWRE